MKTVAAILEDLGKPAQVARDLRAPLTTVVGWKEANFIPEWRRPAVIALAKRLGKPVADADFPPVEARISRKQAAA